MADKNITIVVDNRREISSSIKDRIEVALMACGEIVERAAVQRCPVDTGRLKGSITHQLNGNDAVQIGTNVEYGKWVEAGSSRRPHPTPFLKPALESNEGNIAKTFKTVMGG